MAKAENSANANILEVELFVIIIFYCENHFLSMSKNNFCDAFEAALNAHQSAKNIVDFAITEVLRKNFTANISSKNTPGGLLEQGRLLCQIQYSNCLSFTFM